MMLWHHGAEEYCKTQAKAKAAVSVPEGKLKSSYAEYNSKLGKYYTYFWNSIEAYYPSTDINSVIKDCNKSMANHF
jgi:hypothetical protein